MTQHIAGSWTGWKGSKTTVKLTDGSVWLQAEYHYEYRYQYRPSVVISEGRMMVEGMSRAVKVRRAPR